MTPAMLTYLARTPLAEPCGVLILECALQAASRAPCPACNGTGQANLADCHVCLGSGITQKLIGE